MKSLETKKIERLGTVMSYIRLGLEGTKGDYAKAQWLYHVIQAHMDDVVREDLDAATERRNRLNGSGYNGKAGH